jgi:hypothetical protein
LAKASGESVVPINKNSVHFAFAAIYPKPIQCRTPLSGTAEAFVNELADDLPSTPGCMFPKFS